MEEQIQTHTWHILVIGKDPDILKTVLRLLNDFKKANYRAVGTTDVTEGRRLFEGEDIDLVLLTNGLDEAITGDSGSSFPAESPGYGSSSTMAGEAGFSLMKSPIPYNLKEIRMAQTILHKASERFDVRSERGESRFSFSFGDLYREDRLGFGALRVLNDDIVFPSQGFGSHPHDNMEIISIVQEGELTHQDSLQNEGVARTNRLQIISAGTGIFHSEYNRNPGAVCRILQIWVYPDRMNITPRYQQADYIYPSPPNQWQTIIEPLGIEALDTEALGTESLRGGAPAPGMIQQDAWFSLGQLEKGHKLSYRLKKEGNGVYLFVISGRIAAEGQTLEPKDGLGVTGSAQVEVEALEASEVLLIDVPMIRMY